jgi:hypothetical protein
MRRCRQCGHSREYRLADGRKNAGSAGVGTHGRMLETPVACLNRRGVACWSCSSWGFRCTGSASGFRPVFERSNGSIAWCARAAPTKKNFGSPSKERSSATSPCGRPQEEDAPERKGSPRWDQRVLELCEKLALSGPRRPSKTFPSFPGGDLLSIRPSWRGPFPLVL